MKLKAAAIAALVLGASTSLAQAATYQVSVWTGAPNGVTSSTIANAAHKPTGLASAVFTFTGDINFAAAVGNNTLGAFVGNAGGTTSGFSSPRGTYSSVAQAMAAILSTPGDTIDSFFQITTTYTAASAMVIVTHDDGASLYVDGTTLFDSSGETTVITNTAIIPAGTHTLTLDYVEANGAPAILTVTTTPIPEPAILSMLGASLLAVGGLARRRR